MTAALAMTAQTQPTSRAESPNPMGSDTCGFEATRRNETFMGAMRTTRKETRHFFSRAIYSRLLGTNIGHFCMLIGLSWLGICIGMLLWYLTGGSEEYGTTLAECFWVCYILFADPGTQTGFGVEEWGRVRAVAVVVSWFGVFFVLTLMGLIVDFMRQLLKHYKETYSCIFAHQHVLIVGWNDKIFFLLNELFAVGVKAGGVGAISKGLLCCKRRRLQVVILSKRPVQEMSQEVEMYFHSDQASDRSVADIYYRQGDPADRTELMKVSTAAARDIIVMAEGRRNTDQYVIQALLALAALPLAGRSLTAEVHAELLSSDCKLVAETVLGKAQVIVTREAVMRMLVLRALFPNVGYVFLQLATSKRGTVDLFTCTVPPQLVGTAFEDVCRHFPHAVCCGIEAGDQNGLIPREDRRHLQASDTLLLLAYSAAEAAVCEPLEAMEPESPTEKRAPLESSWTSSVELLGHDGQLQLARAAADPKVVVIVGCPLDYPLVLEMLDEYLAPQSKVHILSQKKLDQREEILLRHLKCRSGIAESLDNGLSGTSVQPWQRIQVVHHVGVPTNRGDLADLPLSIADSCLILSEQMAENEAPIALDSRNLSAVVMLKALSSAKRLNESKRQPNLDTAKRKMKIVTEILDAESQQVIETNDSVRAMGSFVYTCANAAGLLAMSVLQPKELRLFFRILDPTSGAAHITLLPVKDFVRGSEALSYLDVHSRIWSACRGVLLGWRRSGERYATLNPNKTEAFTWCETSKDEEFIVLRPHPTGILGMPAAPPARELLVVTPPPVDAPPSSPPTSPTPPLPPAETLECLDRQAASCRDVLQPGEVPRTLSAELEAALIKE